MNYYFNKPVYYYLFKGLALMLLLVMTSKRESIIVNQYKHMLNSQELFSFL